MTTTVRAPASLLVSVVSATGVLDGLSPRTWRAPPQTKLRPLAPVPKPPGSTGFGAILGAWNTGTIDTRRNRLLIWGGGHNDYAGNDLYALDLTTFRWSRIWGPTPNAQIPVDGTKAFETYLDGNPGSRHTYGGMVYVPALDVLWVYGGLLWQSGSPSRAVWHYHCGPGAWERKADAPLAGTCSAVHDPVTGHVFVQTATNFYDHDPVADTWTRVGRRTAGLDARRHAAIDPVRRRFYLCGSPDPAVPRMWAYDLSALAPPTLQELRALAPSGDVEICATAYPGVTYDTLRGTLVGWHGGPDVFEYEADADRWAKIPAAPGNSVFPPALLPSRVVLGHWQYVPVYDAAIAVTSVDADVLVYRR